MMQKFTQTKKRGRPAKPRMQFCVNISEENEDTIYKALSKSLPTRKAYKIVNLIATIEYTNTENNLDLSRDAHN